MDDPYTVMRCFLGWHFGYMEQDKDKKVKAYMFEREALKEHGLDLVREFISNSAFRST